MIQNILLVPTSIRDDDLKGHLPALLNANKAFHLLYVLEQSFCSEVLSTLTESCVYIDFKWLIDQHHEYHQFLDTLQVQIPSLTHCDHVDLKRQILKLLEEDGLEVTTDLHLLKQYSTQHHLYMQLYQLIKKQNFYKQWVMKLQPYKTEDSKRLRLHGTWRSSTSYTGRITASKVNLTALPNAMKPYIVPSSQASTIWSVDFNNAELRCVAYLSQDKQLLDDLTNDIDVHSVIGSMIGMVINQAIPNNDLRKTAKTFIFAMLYGAGDTTLCNILVKNGVCATVYDVKRLKQFIYERYNFLETYFEQTVKREWVDTFYGPIYPLVPMSEPQKKNFAFQSMIASALKLLAITCVRQNLEVINLIHDEVWVQVPNSNEALWQEQLKKQFTKIILKEHPSFPINGFLKVDKLEDKYNAQQ